jgi:hypothetical protein
MEAIAIVAVLVTTERSDAAALDVDVQSHIPSVTATSLLPSANKKSGKAAGVAGAVHWRCSTEAAPWVDRSADVMGREGVGEEEAASRVAELTRALPRDICTPIVRAAFMMHVYMACAAVAAVWPACGHPHARTTGRVFARHGYRLFGRWRVRDNRALHVASWASRACKEFNTC